MSLRKLGSRVGRAARALVVVAAVSVGFVACGDSGAPANAPVQIDPAKRVDPASLLFAATGAAAAKRNIAVWEVSMEGVYPTVPPGDDRLEFPDGKGAVLVVHGHVKGGGVVARGLFGVDLVKLAAITEQSTEEEFRAAIPVFEFNEADGSAESGPGMPLPAEEQRALWEAFNADVKAALDRPGEASQAISGEWATCTTQYYTVLGTYLAFAAAVAACLVPTPVCIAAVVAAKFAYGVAVQDYLCCVGDDLSPLRTDCTCAQKAKQNPSDKYFRIVRGYGPNQEYKCTGCPEGSYWDDPSSQCVCPSGKMKLKYDPKEKTSVPVCSSEQVCVRVNFVWFGTPALVDPDVCIDIGKWKRLPKLQDIGRTKTCKDDGGSTYCFIGKWGDSFCDEPSYVGKPGEYEHSGYIPGCTSYSATCQPFAVQELPYSPTFQRPLPGRVCQAEELSSYYVYGTGESTLKDVIWCEDDTTGRCPK